MLIERSPNNSYNAEQALRFFGKNGAPGESYEYFKELKANAGNSKSFKKLISKSAYLRGIETAIKVGHEGYHREDQYRASEITAGGSSNSVNDLVYIKKNDRLLCSMDNSDIHLVDPETAESVDYKYLEERWTNKVAVSPDERYAAVSTIAYSKTVNVFTIIIYEIEESRLTQVAKYKLGKGLRSFAFGPKGDTLYFFDRSDDELTSTFNSWEFQSESKPNVIYTYQEPKKSNYSSVMKYLPLTEEMLFTAEAGLYSYDLASKEIKVHEVDPRLKGATFLSVDMFADGKYLAAVTYTHKSKATPQLHIFDAQSKALLQQLPMKVEPKTKQVYKIKTQKGQNENEWHLTSSGADKGIARWKLSLVDDQFDLTLSSYNVIDGYMINAMAVNTDDPESPMYIGDEMGLIGVWKDSE